jgi:cytochrome c-type biogenesis protein CcmH
MRQGIMQAIRMRLSALMFAVMAIASSIGIAHAVTPQEILPDKALEHRAREISAELRCLVCQNQSIDDSDAPLAHDLRVLVRERLKAGDTNEQVFDFVVARYGDFVLLKPPFSMQTLLLWCMPLLALGAAVLILRNMFGSPQQAPNTNGSSTSAALSPEEQSALDALLKQEKNELS